MTGTAITQDSVWAVMLRSFCGAVSRTLFECVAQIPAGTYTVALSGAFLKCHPASGVQKILASFFFDWGTNPLIDLTDIKKICLLWVQGTWELRESIFIQMGGMSKGNRIKSHPLHTQNYTFFLQFFGWLAINTYLYIQMLIRNVHWDYSLNILIYIQA